MKFKRFWLSLYCFLFVFFIASRTHYCFHFFLPCVQKFQLYEEFQIDIIPQEARGIRLINFDVEHVALYEEWYKDTELLG